MYATNFDDLQTRMAATEQTAGVSVLEHGHSVHQRYQELLRELNQGKGNPTLQKVWESVRERLMDPDLIWRYQVYHDCGKPACAQDGHFPDHAEHSANQWALLFPEDPVVADLMRMDMQFHLTNAEDARSFWAHPLAPTLYVTAWAEILSNASMFGGEDSTSFKIKRKKLERAGRALW
jgi:hypothetical protein